MFFEKNAIINFFAHDIVLKKLLPANFSLIVTCTTLLNLTANEIFIKKKSKNCISVKLPRGLKIVLSLIQDKTCDFYYHY